MAHEGERNIPLGRLLHPIRLNINILFVFVLFFFPATLSLINKSYSHLRRLDAAHLRTVFADEVSSLDRFSFCGINLPAARAAKLSLAVKQY